MSDLGKIRPGSARVYRDRIFGVRGQCITLGADHSVDGMVRFVCHPDDIDESMAEVLTENIGDLERAAATPRATRWTVFDLRIIAPDES